MQATFLISESTRCGMSRATTSESVSLKTLVPPASVVLLCRRRIYGDSSIGEKDVDRRPTGGTGNFDLLGPAGDLLVFNRNLGGRRGQELHFAAGQLAVESLLETLRLAVELLAGHFHADLDFQLNAVGIDRATARSWFP